MNLVTNLLLTVLGDLYQIRILFDVYWEINVSKKIDSYELQLLGNSTSWTITVVLWITEEDCIGNPWIVMALHNLPYDHQL